MNLRYFVGFAATVTALVAFSDNYIWYAADKSASGDFNGSFTDGTHWFKGSVGGGTSGVVPPLATDTAQMFWSTGWTMTFPTIEANLAAGEGAADGACETLAKFQSTVHPGQKQTYDGTGSIFRNAFNENADSTTDSRMAVYYSTTTSSPGGTDFMRTLNNLGTIAGMTDPTKKVPAWEFTDFKYSIEASATGNEMKMTFEKGDFNFLTPGGYVWDKSTQMPSLYFFGANTASCPMDKNEVEFLPGTSLKVSALSIQGTTAPTNVFKFHGGDHLVGNFYLASRINGWSINENRTVTDVIVDNGAQLMVTNQFQVFDNANSSNRVGRVLVSDLGTKLTLPAMTGNRGEQTFLAKDGGEMVFGLDGLKDQSLNSDLVRSIFLGAENGGKITIDHKGAAAGANGKGLFFGIQSSAVTEPRHTLSIDNGILAFKPGGKINVYTAKVDVKNGATVDNDGATFAIRGGDVAGSVRTTFVLDGSAVTNRNSATMHLGEGVAGADLLLTNGATVVYKSSGSTQVGNGTVTMAPGAVIENDGGAIRLQGVADGATATMVIDGAAVTNVNSAEFALSVNGLAHLVLTNKAVMANDIDIFIGGSSGGGSSYAAAADKQGAQLDVYDSRIDVLSNTSARTLRLGYRAGVTGKLNLYSGSINYFISGTTGHGPIIGEYGHGELNVYGGVLDCFRPRMGTNDTGTYDYSQGPESVFRLLGGEVIARCQGNGSFVGFAVGGDNTYGSTKRKCRLVLDGGVLTCYTTYGGKSAQCNGGTGWVALEANGGRVRMLSLASSVTISKFDEAKVGPKGLTFDSIDMTGVGRDNTVAQHVWANKDGEDGALIFTGDKGSTTITGNVEQVTYLIADGGTVNLTKLDGYALNTLIVTNGGCAILDPMKTLKVADDVRIDGTSTIKVSSNVAVGQVKALFEMAAEPSETTLKALREAVCAGRLTNLGANRTASLDVVPVDDHYELRMTVREGQTLTIELEDNAVSNATENVVFDLMDTLAAEVGDSSVLTLSGLYRYGSLAIASGWGKRLVPDFGKLQVNGLKMTEGVLEITGPDPVVFDGQPSFDQSTTNNIFILKNDVDVTMACPKGSGGQGEFMKRGPGRLTFTVEGTSGYAFPGGCGYCKTGNGGVWAWDSSGLNQLCFDAVSDMVATSGIPPFAVVEGELVFRGTVPNAKVLAKGDIGIGLSTKEGSVQPGLVLDNVCLQMDTHPHNYFTMGAAVNRSDREDDFVEEPYLILTNNAKLSCAQFFVGRFSQSATMRPKIVVIDSTLDAAAYFMPSDADAATVQPDFTFKNATLTTRIIEPGWDHEIVFDNTLIARRSDYLTNPSERFVALGKGFRESNKYTGTYTFKNNSQVWLGRIAVTNLNPELVHPFRLIFDDADWYPTNDVGACTLAWECSDNFELIMTNKGVRLTVPASNVWTLEQPLIGSGGMIKKGAGSLKFGAGCVQFAGTAKIEDGDIDCAEAGTIEALTAGGSGELKNVTARRFVLSAPFAEGTVAEKLTVNGLVADVAYVDLGHDEQSPVDPSEISDLVVGSYSGAKPSAALWRLKGTGLSGVRGVFAIENNQIILKSIQQAPGMMMLVR